MNPFILLLIQVNSFSFDLSTKADPSCFSLYVIQDELFIFNYLISGSKDYNVRVVLLTPSGSIIYTSPPRTREATRSFKASSEGYFKMCFYNKDPTTKKVTFDLAKRKNLLNDVENLSHAHSLCNTFETLGELLEKVLENVKFYMIRENVYAELSEKITSLVLKGASFKMFCIILVFCLQVYSVLKIFNDGKVSV